MKLEKGQSIIIYDDKISGKGPERKGRLVRRLIRHPGEEYWHVRFAEEQCSTFCWISTLPEKEGFKTEEVHLDS